MTDPVYTLRYLALKTIRAMVQRELRKRWSQIQRFIAHLQKYPVPRLSKKFVSGAL